MLATKMRGPQAIKAVKGSIERMSPSIRKWSGLHGVGKVGERLVKRTELSSVESSSGPPEAGIRASERPRDFLKGRCKPSSYFLYGPELCCLLGDSRRKIRQGVSSKNAQSSEEPRGTTLV